MFNLKFNDDLFKILDGEVKLLLINQNHLNNH